jgi:release factor glutamine methyltransferase
VIPDHERERLVMAVTGRSRAELALGGDLDADQQRRLDALVSRRTAGEPLQHLEGTVQFGPIELTADGRALIPRPETEQLWEEAVRSLGDAGPGTAILDLCTGSGNLALALKHAFGEARVLATDTSEDALALAKENGGRLGLEVEFLHGNLYEPIPKRLMGRFDLIVVNPPYVTDDEYEALPDEIRLHEPRQALVAGPEGTETLAAIADEAFWWVGVGGWVICEIGETQGDQALDLFGGFDREVRKDLAGRDRFLVARKGASCCL